MTITPDVVTGTALVVAALIFAPVLLRSMLGAGGLTLAGGGLQPADDSADEEQR